MKSIKVKNFRSFRDSSDIYLKPITVLVGKNSSGKSSIMRTFPLLKQSYQSRIRGPILWYGDYVDFGSFNETINRYSDNSTMTFEYYFESYLSEIDYIRSRSSEKSKTKEIRAKIDITNKGNESEEFVKSTEFTFFDHKLTLHFDNSTVTSIKINDIEFIDEVSSNVKVFTSGLVPVLLFKDDDESYLRYYNNSNLIKNFIPNIKQFLHKSIADDTILNILKNINLDTKQNMISKIKTNGKHLKSWEKLIKSPGIVEQIVDYIVLSNISNITETVSEYLSQYYQNTYYIAPVRATAERYYRIQNLSLDEVDHSGKNLAMFIKNMTKTELSHFQNWTEEHFKFKPIISSKEGHVSIQIQTVNSSDKTNLADTGFGYSQILPIITQLWVLIRKNSTRHYYRRLSQGLQKTFIIEQPELHLHPAMQAQMVKSFVSAVRAAREKDIDLKIIFETHSRTIIDTLGRMVDEFDNDLRDEINICVVNKVEDTATINSSKFDDEGYLQNWPFGFFDTSEAF